MVTKHLASLIRMRMSRHCGLSPLSSTEAEYGD
jgi:hypothetical protein